MLAKETGDQGLGAAATMAAKRKTAMRPIMAHFMAMTQFGLSTVKRKECWYEAERRERKDKFPLRVGK